MAHQIKQGPHPNVMLLRIYGQLTDADMMCDEALRLNEGQPMYVLLDASEINVALPDNFLNGAHNSFFVNDNLQHMSLYLNNMLLRNVAQMVAKITQRKHKMTLHNTYESGLAHLLTMVELAEIS